MVRIDEDAMRTVLHNRHADDALVAIAVGVSGCSYNKFTTAGRSSSRRSGRRCRTRSSAGMILIPNLVETVKGYATHRGIGVSSEIADSRSRLLAAKTPEETIAASNQQSSALGRLLAVAENYPNLKANEQFNRLMDELVGHREPARDRAHALQRAHSGVQHAAPALPVEHDGEGVRLQGIPAFHRAAGSASRRRR